MILIQQLKLHIPHREDQIKKKAAQALGIKPEEILSMEIIRRSLDARKKPDLFYIYSVEVAVEKEHKILNAALKNKKAKEQFSLSTREVYCFPKGANVSTDGMMHVALESENCKSDRSSPVIVGAGPAGLFCAYYLSLAGLNPILLERGKPVEERTKDVEAFWETGVLNPSSNVQFGEGGAGTFSDGKLNTLVKDKDGRNRAVLETFIKFGAKKSIVYDAKPHIGTDELSKVVKRMREAILANGGTVRFESQVTDIRIRDNQVEGVVINDHEELSCRQLVLAIGHSARDTFEMLLRKGIPMEPKAFAVGFRVEHPQEMINQSQYGLSNTPENRELLKELGAAAYKVTAKTDSGRGVYSFCMCPGGYVVNASSEPGRLAVNGMSYSGRDGKNANSAIIVSVEPSDYPGDGPLAGIAFQRSLEEKAYALGGGKIPVQRYGDYKKAVEKKRVETNADSVANDSAVVFSSKDWGFMEKELTPSVKGAYSWTDLSTLLPEECSKAFVQGMEQFGKQMKGFNNPASVLLGVESRTSSPVRIQRDEQLMCSVKGIYPCGEGAGYAGGITSAAMDGLRVAEQISCLTK